MKYLLLIFLCIPAALFSQENSRYMPGAVPVTDGKVIFTEVINTPGLSKEQVFDIALAWAQNRFKSEKGGKSRVLYSDREDGMIASMGEEYLTFTRKALALDQALINYQMHMVCSNGKCEAKITAIHYLYSVADKPEDLKAEDMITDENTFNKSRTKMIRSTGKFRTHTIDLVDRLFGDLTAALNKAAGIPPAAMVSTGRPATPPTPAPETAVASIPAVASTASSAMQGYKQIRADQIPGNIIRLLSENWMLITAGNDSQFNMMTASWGGLGYLYNKPVAFCFINPSRYTYQLMEKDDTYTLTFYTETYRDALQYCGSHSGKDTDKVKETGLTPVTTPSGSKAFSEAWMIIECRKLVSQQFRPESLPDGTLRKEWDGKEMHKMYIGEILNVWVK